MDVEADGGSEDHEDDSDGGQEPYNYLGRSLVSYGSIEDEEEDVQGGLLGSVFRSRLLT